jgi:thiamine kinase-like enzyme
LTITLWRYVEPIPGAAPTSAQTAAALTDVHDALADFEGTLPAFTVELNDARRLLHPERSPALKTSERRLLSNVVSEVQATVATLELTHRPLHGSPHYGNWISSADGPLLLDFETACRGPVEWDLAALTDDALALFPDADRKLIFTMRRMRSVCVAAKSWAAPERAPELRDARAST